MAFAERTLAFVSEKPAPTFSRHALKITKTRSNFRVIPVLLSQDVRLIGFVAGFDAAKMNASDAIFAASAFHGTMRLCAASCSGACESAQHGRDVSAADRDPIFRQSFSRRRRAQLSLHSWSRDRAPKRRSEDRRQALKKNWRKSTRRPCSLRQGAREKTPRRRRSISSSRSHRLALIMTIRS